MPHNFPMPDSNHVRFTQEVQQGSSYYVHSKQSYKYLLFEFGGFSQSFTDIAQNITSATYKGVTLLLSLSLSMYIHSYIHIIVLTIIIRI